MVEVSDHWQDFHQLNQPAWRQQRQQTVTLTKHFHAVGGKCPLDSPLYSAPLRPGDLQPHPQQTSPQPASWARSLCQETTDTNPFPEGSSQNQLLGVVFTNKVVLWGWTLRLGVCIAAERLVCIMAGTLGNLRNHLGNARLQWGPFKIRLHLASH